MGVPTGYSRLALKSTVVCAELLRRADLGGIHQGLIDLQLRHAILPADLIDARDHLFPDTHVCGQAVRDGGFLPSGAGDGQREASLVMLIHLLIV